ncbi:MAG: energy transducer TonB [Bacteroidales bacterium]
MKNFRIIPLVIAAFIWLPACMLTRHTVSTEKKSPEQIAEPTVDTEYYATVETPARFQGNDIHAFLAYLKKNIKYPPAALRKRQQGTVAVQFGVNWDGKVEVFSVLKSSGYKLLDDEVVRVIGSSPVWEPAQNQKKRVGQLFLVQVTFQARTRKIDVR